jgi:hypothetical protein
MGYRLTGRLLPHASIMPGCTVLLSVTICNSVQHSDHLARVGNVCEAGSPLGGINRVVTSTRSVRIKFLQKKIVHYFQTLK